MQSARTPPAGFELLCGPAGSGKSTEALGRYAEQVSLDGDDSALLILPTAAVAQRVTANLLGTEALPGLVDPRIFTFPQLAQIILDANRECATEITGAAQRLIIREVVEHLSEAGHLPELAEVSRLPGFTIALSELMSDLKRGAVEPRQFCAALQEAGLNRPWHRELGGLYCAYQWMLICLRTFDEEGLFWWARGVLSRGGHRPLERVKLMVVDGFSDFTTTQLQMLRELREIIPQTVLTLDFVEGDERESLGDWARDTRRRVEAHLGQGTLVPLRPPVETGPLGHLRTGLFAPPGGLSPVPAEGKLHILTCPSRSREVREVLRRVKELLTSGKARPGDIAIVCRSAGERARTIRQAAERLGVPVYVEAGQNPAEAPPVSAVLRAYETVAGGYRREDVVALLDSDHLSFPPLCERKLTACELATVAEEAKILEGRRQWAQRLAAHVSRLERRKRRGDELAQAQVVEAAWRELCMMLPVAGLELTLRQRVAETRELMEVTDLWERTLWRELPGHSSEDMGALGRLGQALDMLEHGRGEADAPIAAGRYAALLREVLEDLADAPPPPAGNRVVVLDARRVRQLRLAHCFIMGLNEGDFPRRRADEAFFSREELHRLASAGVDLVRRRSTEGEEPVLFHAAVCAAEQELWLSCASTDATGNTLQTSHYLQEVRRCFIEGTYEDYTIPLSEVVATPDRIADVQEMAARAVFDLSDTAPGASPCGYNVLRGLPGGVETVARASLGARIEEARAWDPAPSAHNGSLTFPDIIVGLSERFGPDVPFSDTRLSAYGDCPFGFFCSYVLKLGELEAPEAEVSPLDDGKVRHRILAQFAKQRIEARPNLPLVAAGEQQEAWKQLAGIIDREFRRYAEREGVADPALWELERRRCHRDLREWLEHEVERFGEQVPACTELDFGRAEGEEVELPGHPDIRLQGRIDRVNLAGPDFTLIDYKRGKPPGPRQAVQGDVLQFPIYTLGATQALDFLQGAACVGWHYSQVRRPLKPTDITDAGRIGEARDAAVPIIADYVRGIRGGRFAPIEVGGCHDYCPHADACRRDARPERRRSEDAEAGA